MHDCVTYPGLKVEVADFCLSPSKFDWSMVKFKLPYLIN